MLEVIRLSATVRNCWSIGRFYYSFTTLFGVFLIFFFFLSNLSASFQVTVVTENDPSSFVDGVSVISGDFYSYNEDYLVEGAEPISIRRSYLSNGAVLIDRPHVFASFFPLMNMIIASEPNGTPLQYQADPKNGFIPEIGDSFFGGLKVQKILSYHSRESAEASPGLTNTSSGKISGQTCLQNQLIVFRSEEDKKGKSFTLYASDGTKRRYMNLEGQTKTKDPLRRDEFYLRYDYKLVSETLPNGHVIHYLWDHRNQLKQIRTCGKNHRKTFASLDFPVHDPKNPPAEFKLRGSDGRSVHYYRSQTKNQEPSFLEKICVSDLPTQFFGWTKKSRPQLCNYSIPKKRTFQIAYEEGALHRVRTLLAPAGKDETPIPIQSFFYDVAPRQTDVRDAKGFKTSYFWNDKYRLTHIDRFGEGDSFINSEVFVWDGTRIKSKWLIDQDRKPIFFRGYKYDPQGNVVEECFSGNLSGEGPPLAVDLNEDPSLNGVECFVKRSIYIDQNKHLLQEESGPHGLSTRYQYLNDTNLPAVKELLDHGEVKIRHVYTYDEDLVLVCETISDGQTVRIKKIHSVQEGPYLGLPEIIEEKYLDQGHERLLRKTVLRYTEGAKIKQKEIYDADGKLRYTLQFTYDRGKIATETNPLGQTAEYRYDEIGNRIYSKDFSGRVETTFDYDYSNRLIRKEEKGFDGMSRVYSYDYDTKHNRVLEVDHFGQETRYQYDAFNRLVRTERASRITEQSYDSAGNEICRIDPERHATRKSYNAYGDPVSVIHPDGSIDTYSYYLDGSFKSHTDPEGITTEYQYDFLKRIVRKTILKAQEILAEETIVYQGNLLLKKTDAEGNSATYRYDGAGRKIGEEFGNQLITYTYDSLGRVHKTQKGDLCTIIEYDLADRVIEERNESISGELFRKLCYRYDAAGNRSEIIRNIASKESVETFLYDSQNRLISKTDALGAAETIEYNDQFRNLLRENVLLKIHTDSMGLQTIETYTVDGQVSSIEKRKGKTLHFSEKFYNKNLQQTLQIDTIFSPDGDSRQNLGSWEYNNRGRLVTLIEALNSCDEKVTWYTYTPTGALKTVTKPSGKVLTYCYNDLNQLISLSSSDRTVFHTMSYNKLGQLIYTDGITRRLNPQGQILAESFPSGLLIQHEYDKQGRVTQSQMPLFDCFIVYEYSGADLKQITRKTLKDQSLYTHIYQSHDLSGNLLESKLINGQTIRYQIDPLSRTTKIDTPLYSQEVVAFDSARNIRKMRIQQDLVEYGYDDLYQLTSESGLFAHQYWHDSIHNRLQKDDEIYEVNALNEVTSYFVYDLDGNPIRHNDTFYTYDALDRLIRIETPSFVQQFTYDSLHRCLSKTIIQEGIQHVLYFLYEGQNEIGAVDDRLHPAQLRILGCASHAEIGAAIALELDGVIYAPVHDLQGNIAVLSPLEGQESTFYRYSAFGEEWIHGSAPNPWKFSSKRTDSVTSLINFGRRYYLPSLGRWLTPDPAGFSDGMNLYAFVRNSPLIHLDDYGLAMDLATEKGTAEVYYQCAASQDIKNYLDGKYPFQNHYLHYQPPKSTPFYAHFDTTRIRPKGEIVVFTGINTKFYGKGEFAETLSYISSQGSGLPVHGIHMPTHGQFQDIRKCQYTLAMGSNSTVLHGAQYLREASERVGPDGRILALGHSGGGMNLFFASLLVSPEIRAKINYVTFASAKIIPRTDVSKFVQNYRSSNRDHLMWYLQKAYPEEYESAVKSGLMTLIPAHPDASKINDHSILSPTFSNKIKDVLDDFIDQYDCR